MIEVDESGVYTCTATPVDGSAGLPVVTEWMTLLKEVPAAFQLSGQQLQ